MQVGHLFKSVAPANIRMHRVALNGTRTNECNFNDQVVELARLKPGQRCHLCATLDLKHTDRIGDAQHVVDGVVLRDFGNIDGKPIGLGNCIDGVMQRSEHAETKKVELH